MGNPLTSRRKAITLLRPLIGAWMRKTANYRLIDPPPSNVGNPYLIICNHVSIYDLTYVLLQLKEMPVIVIHEVFQRNPIAAWILRPLGLIWKQADLHDAKTIRQMKRAAKASRSILLYPEGDLTWDGVADALPAEIVRLIRYVGLPVLIFKEMGAYMTYPRWAASVRKGRVDLSFKLVLDERELNSLDDEQILNRLNSAFRHSERDWTIECGGEGVVFASKKPAGGLSKMLFMCPACQSVDCLKESDTAIRCLSCGYESNIDEALRMDDAGVSGFRDIWEWHGWQVDAWKDKVAEEAGQGRFTRKAPLAKAELVRAKGAISGDVTRAGFNSRFLSRPLKFDAAQARLTNLGLEIIGKDGTVQVSIPFQKMKSARVLPMHIYRPNWLLISTDEGYYKLLFKDWPHPPYSWCLAIRQLI